MIFDWPKRELRLPSRGKLVRKIPMDKRVVDDKGALWRYHFISGKLEYIFIGYVMGKI